MKSIVQNLHKNLIEDGFVFEGVGLGNFNKNKPPYENAVKNKKISHYLIIAMKSVEKDLKLKGIQTQHYTHAIYIKR